MTYYRAAWRTCWAALALLLLLAGLLVGSVGAFLVTAVLAGLIGAVVAAALLQNDGGTRVPVPLHNRVAGCLGLRVGVLAGLLSAWAAVVGSLVIPLLVAAAVTSPPLVAALLRKDRRSCSPGPVPEAQRCRCGCAEPVSAEEMRMMLAVLSNAELTRAWRHSLVRLRQARSATEWSGLLALRAACLSEMQDRDPRAVTLWLASLPAPTTAPDLSRAPTATEFPAVPPPET